MLSPSVSIMTPGSGAECAGGEGGGARKEGDTPTEAVKLNLSFMASLESNARVQPLPEMAIGLTALLASHPGHGAKGA